MSGEQVEGPDHHRRRRLVAGQDERHDLVPHILAAQAMPVLAGIEDQRDEVARPAVRTAAGAPVDRVVERAKRVSVVLRQPTGKELRQRVEGSEPVKQEPPAGDDRGAEPLELLA